MKRINFHTHIKSYYFKYSMKSSHFHLMEMHLLFIKYIYMFFTRNFMKKKNKRIRSLQEYLEKMTYACHLSRAHFTFYFSF